MHGDEPDNAQDIAHWKSIEDIRAAWPEAPNKTLAQWGGYGPPIPPKDIQAGYDRIRKADPSRPVLLNLGQGVAYDKYIGRGYRSGKVEDYPEYLKGCDIVSFDIYPVAHAHADISGNLWYVALGVERLTQWAAGQKTVWNCIECTHIQTPDKKATPQQVRCEVWMSLVRGSMGLIYFVHEWTPRFDESALLSDPEMLRSVTSLNRQIQRLAPVLNSPAVPGAVTVSSSTTDVPIAAMAKKFKGDTYVFAVGMRAGSATGTFTLAGASAGSPTVEVIDEKRTIASVNGVFKDDFGPWDVHLYRISAPR
jgi:hypothetical protein